LKGVTARYEPAVFEGLVLDLGPSPEGTGMTAILFGSGKVVLSGATTQETLELAVKRTAEILAKAGVKVYAAGG